jgi:hypothetical protein
MIGLSKISTFKSNISLIRIRLGPNRMHSRRTEADKSRHTLRRKIP